MRHLLCISFLLIGLPLINANDSGDFEDGVKAFRSSEHSVSGEENEIFTVKCSHQMLAYIINTLYNQGFRIISVSCNEPVDPIWVIKYAY